MPIPSPSVVCRLALTAVSLRGHPRGPIQAALPKVPDGFKIRLVAAVPAVQFPCQVATAPDGSLFVGEDPMDQVGPADKPIDRILLFRDGKDPVVFAEKLNAIFGMVWHDGALYVMNMPHLTVLRDRDGDGKADERKELFTDLGVPAGSPNDFNDHIVSGLKIGIDGYLYISVGDKGVPKATGPDGRTAQVVGGGTLRCRPDGTGLEVFTTGTRNHLEPNLDDRDNLFTYDNTDDGLGWWTRVTHHVDGGYYGYPVRLPQPDRPDAAAGWPSTAAARRAAASSTARTPGPRNTAAGSSGPSGASAPSRRSGSSPTGATFKVADKIDFVEPGEVESFRPLDLALSPDGKTMYVADWSHGRLGQQDREARPGLRGDLRRADASRPGRGARTPTRSKPRSSSSTIPSFNERRRAQAALIRTGQDGAGRPSPRLADPKTDPRRQAAPRLGRSTRSPAARPRRRYPLIDALKSPVADVRAQAARALGERGRADRRGAADRAAQGPRAGGPAPGDDRAGADRRRRGRSRAAAGRGRQGRLSSPSRHGGRSGGSATGRPPRVGSTRPTRRSAPASCSRWSRCTTPTAVGRSGRFAVVGRAPARRADQGDPVTWPRSHRKAPPVGRQVVGHAAGQERPARPDDRLGGDAARAGDRPRAADATRRAAVRIAAVEALAEAKDQDSRATHPVAVRRREGRGRPPRDRAGARQARRIANRSTC